MSTLRKYELIVIARIKTKKNTERFVRGIAEAISKES